jgi:hypothetical protein
MPSLVMLLDYAQPPIIEACIDASTDRCAHNLHDEIAF